MPHVLASNTVDHIFADVSTGFARMSSTCNTVYSVNCTQRSAGSSAMFGALPTESESVPQLWQRIVLRSVCKLLWDSRVVILHVLAITRSGLSSATEHILSSCVAKGLPRNPDLGVWSPSLGSHLQPLHRAVRGSAVICETQPIGAHHHEN